VRVSPLLELVADRMASLVVINGFLFLPTWIIAVSYGKCSGIPGNASVVLTVEVFLMVVTFLVSFLLYHMISPYSENLLTLF